MKDSYRLLLPFIVFLSLIAFCYGIILCNWERLGHGVLLLRFVAIPLTALWIGVSLSYKTGFMEWLENRCSGVRSWRIITFAALIYFILLLTLKLSKLFTLNYEYFDAGLYINKLFRISEVGLVEASLLAFGEGHFQPVMVIYAFAYEMFNSAWLPFALETAALASGIFPLFFLARKLLKNEFSATVICLAYLFNPLVQFNDILGFHPDHIVLPALLWAFYFAEVGRFAKCLLALIIVSLSSEPWIPLAAAFGIYLSVEHKKYFLGALVFTFFTMLFLYILFFLLDDFGSSNSGRNLFAGPGSPYDTLRSPGLSHIWEILSNPRKLFFFLFICFPFVGVLFFSIPVAIVAIPDLLKILFSKEMLHFSVEGHYTLGLIGILFVSYVKGLNMLTIKNGSHLCKKVPIWTLAATVGISIAHSPLPLSFNFWSGWSGGAFHYANYLPSDKTHSLRKIEGLLGYDASQKIELTNRAFTPELGRRNRPIYLFPTPDWRASDFVIIDKREHHGAGSEFLQEAYEEKLDAAQRELPLNNFSLIYDDANVQLWRNRETI